MNHSVELCNQFFSLINPIRLTKKPICSKIVSAIHNVYIDKEQGLKFLNSLKDLDKETMDYIFLCYENPEENKTIKTLAWYARRDNRVKYLKFINSNNCPIPKGYRNYWLDVVCFEKFGKIHWYQYARHRWNIRNNLKQDITEHKDLFMDQNFEKILDENVHLTGFQNGCLVIFVYNLFLRDGIPEDYISLFTKIDYINKPFVPEPVDRLKLAELENNPLISQLLESIHGTKSEKDFMCFSGL